VPKPTVMVAAEQISPELVLVSPELRERALDALTAVDAEALFVVAPRPAPEKRRSFTVAFAAYLGEAVVLGALRGALLFAVIAIAAFLLAR
jgi:hypothetical protein